MSDTKPLCSHAGLLLLTAAVAFAAGVGVGLLSCPHFHIRTGTPPN